MIISAGGSASEEPDAVKFGRNQKQRLRLIGGQKCRLHPECCRGSIVDLSHALALVRREEATEQNNVVGVKQSQSAAFIINSTRMEVGGLMPLKCSVCASLLRFLKAKGFKKKKNTPFLHNKGSQSPRLAQNLRSINNTGFGFWIIQASQLRVSLLWLNFKGHSKNSFGKK